MRGGGASVTFGSRPGMAATDRSGGGRRGTGGELSVPCAIPVTLEMLSGRPRAVVCHLQVAGAIVEVEHAVPNDAFAWIRLPLPDGARFVRARVVGVTPLGSAWRAELRFEVPDPRTRAGLSGLVQVLAQRQSAPS